MANKKTKTRRTRFVPQAILGTAFVGVIPACALALPGCGSSGQGQAPDAGQFAVGQGVAVAAFFDAGADQFAVGQGVAVAAFFDSGPDTGHDSGADAAPKDASEDQGGNDSGTG